MKYAMIFPGQGAQRPGMGKDIYERYISAKRIFDEADEALGFSLSDIIFNGTPEELAHTEITQPAILTVSVAMFRALEQELGTAVEPSCMAGHSLGEYTALAGGRRAPRAQTRRPYAGRRPAWSWLYGGHHRDGTLRRQCHLRRSGEG